MSEMVQVALAGDATEAEEIQALLEDAGIASEITPDDDSDSLEDPRSRGSGRVGAGRDRADARRRGDHAGGLILRFVRRAR